MTILAAAMMLLAAAGQDRAPRTELLVDDHIVESQTNIATLQMRPSSGQEVLVNDKPWEQRIFYPEVLRADGKFRLFYNVGLASNPKKNVVGIAESSDGVTFTKPDLAEKEGGTRSNIVFRDAHGPGLVYDPAGPPERRYKMAYAQGGMAVAFSADGNAFTPYSGNPVIRNKSDTKQSIVWDPARGKWVWFFRYWEKPLDGRTGWSEFKQEIRSVARSESSDFIHWTEPQVILRRSAADPELSDFYGLQVSVRGDLMIGMLWVSDWNDAGGRVGRQRAELVVSRDGGFHWSRINSREPFFDLGATGGFDTQVVWPSAVVADDDRELIYYIGANIEHAVTPVEKFPLTAYRLGVRTLKRDRFVARHADSTKGVLITKAIAIEAGDNLYLNAAVAPGGYIKVQVIDQNGRALSENSHAVTGDDLRSRVIWPNFTLSAAANNRIHLRFEIVNAALFTFTLQ